ncbi:MAG: hypothetical protein MJ175_02710 [Clostridia bacterium]|nr:hypothetical protein [Clostridia bacterium]
MDLFEHSKWLWNQRYKSAENQYLDFYENFRLETPAEKYILHISADSNYAVYVNGKLAAFGQYADYENYKIYDTVDLSGMFRPGDNELKITVHSTGRNFSTYRIAQPGIIYSLYADDELFIISSDETAMAVNPCYQSGPMEVVSGQLGFTYAYDATKEGQKPDLRRAEVINKPKDLLPRPIKKLVVGEDKPALILSQGVFMDTRSDKLSIGQRVEYAFLSHRELEAMTGVYGPKYLPQENGLTFRGEKFDNAADGIYTVLDLGEETAGVLSLDIDCPHDTDIWIGYGEHLDDLRPRSYVGTRNFAVKVRMKAGRNTFVGPFLRMGLRFLQLNICADNCTIYYAGVRPTDYPLDHTPYFHCADHLHNKIYEISVRTLELCMHEHYEDCPWREQSLYTMDSRNQMLCGYYAFGEVAFARESLRIAALSLRDDGMLELCSPAVVSITIPSFTAIFVTQLEEYLRYTGDLDFVREMLPTARAIIRAFTAQLDNPEKLLRCRKESIYWNYYEWQDGLSGSIGSSMDESKQTYDAPMNAFFSMALRAMAAIEEACGNPAEAEALREEKADLDAAINRLFWDRDKQVFASFVNMQGEKYHYAELSNALLVCADVCSPEKEDAILAAFAEKTLLPITVSHSVFKYDAMLRRPAKYAKWVFDEVADIWGKMLYNGATSFYETEDGSHAFGNAGSLCHGWSAVPVYLYFAYVLGLKPTANGYTRYEIKPLDTGIHDASGLAVTPIGQISL